MQVSDYLGQYANTLANASASTAAPPGTGNVAAGGSTQNLVSTLTELAEGAVFEGSINAIDGSKVMLGLSNGQTIAARLDGNISLMLGQSVFFQVKSNDGKTVAIKPFAGGAMFNPTIQKALDAAGMEMTKDTIDMVNRMMQEGMPIDKNSLASMRQVLMQNPRVPMETAVLMAKLGIPVNDEMAAQFQNYLNDRHSMLGQMEQVMDGLPSVFAKSSAGASELLQLNQQILSILNIGEHTQGLGQQAGLDEGSLFAGQGADAAQGTNGQSGQGADGLPGQGSIGQGADGMPGSAGQGSIGAPGQEAFGIAGRPGQEADGALGQSGQGADAALGEATEHAAADRAFGRNAAVQENGPQAGALLENEQTRAADHQSQEPRTLDSLLQKHQIADLEAQLKELFPGAGKLNTKLTAKEFLDAVAGELNRQQPASQEPLRKLFSAKGYQALLKEVMQQEWTLKPQDLKSGHKVAELYDRLSRQMGQIEQLAKQAGMDTGRLSQAASQVRDNIEFMHQINQAYTYVQIPLKLANQNAHSDLYVYTNKRNLKKKEGELSAFLHLELEHLGSTDVSIKMLDNNVTTKFYLSDHAAYELIEAHLPKLQERLSKLGYHCSISIENREEKVDFVEDFLQKNRPSQSASRGMVHRYSFDVRA